MKSFTVYEMVYTGGEVSDGGDISPIPFSDEYYPQYERVYNECFHEMRRCLEIEPYDFYSDISQLDGKKAGIFLLTDNGTIIGSVACFGSEIDDLIVNREYQDKGYGGALLRWAIARIRSYSDQPVTLHVAGWNRKALKLYERSGFAILKEDKIS